jgi:hypothetical protein
LYIYQKIYENTKAFIGLLRASKYFPECTNILVQKNLINWNRNIFKSASNTFFLASLVYLKELEILPLYFSDILITFFSISQVRQIHQAYILENKSLISEFRFI